MWWLLVLCLYASCNAFTVPEEIEKLSSTLIKNHTNYYKLMTSRSSPVLIQSTKDPISWPSNTVTTLLSAARRPLWAKDERFFSLDMNVIADNMVRLYFSALSVNMQSLAIGVAFSTEIDQKSGYVTLNSPIIECGRTCNYTDPSLIITADRLYLASTYEHLVTDLIFTPLTNDGLGWTGARPLVIKSNLAWEGSKMKKPWGFEKNGFIYIFYEAEGGVGVARRRSNSYEDDFEKMFEPLMKISKSMPDKHQLQKSLIWQSNGWPSLHL